MQSIGTNFLMRIFNGKNLFFILVVFLIASRLYAQPACNAHFSHYSKTTHPDSVHFYPPSNASNAHYSWTFGDGSSSTSMDPWHEYAGPGKYYACLTVTDTNSTGNCTDTWCDSVTVTALPAPICNAHFSHYTIQNPDSVHFYTQTNGSTAHYSWSFGDGTYSSLLNPWHLYPGPGVYYACLTVTDTTSGGTCTDTWCDSIRITAPTAPTCNAHFSHYPKTCFPDSVHLYPPTNGSTARYSWAFGDGTYSTLQAPWHVYPGPGGYSCCLTVTDTTYGGTCSDIWCDSVYVTALTAPSCNAHYTYYPKTTNPDSIHFIHQTNGSTAHYHWNFGDGNSSTYSDPWHLYAGPGVYYSCLTVTDTVCGGTCSDTWCDSVHVMAAPAPACNAHFSHYSKTTNADSVHFYPPTNGSGAHYSWTFGDGSSSTLMAPWHLYAGYGVYYACLTVTDTTSGGTCTDTWCDSIRVTGPAAPSCNAHFSHYSKTTYPDSVHFYTQTNGSTAHYQWTFGDGSSSTQLNPWHVYPGPGGYSACLTVTDTTSGGTCSDTWCDSVYVTSPGAPNCNAHFSHYSKSTNADSVHFYPPTNGSGAHYSWTFGDGNSSTNMDPWHLYPGSGVYYACLTVTDTTSGGTCTDTWCDSVHVTAPGAPICNAHFAHYSMNNPDSVHFYPTGSNASNAHYFWDFGDGNTSTLFAPWHLYANRGTYTVCLTVTDTTSYGTCSDRWCDTSLVILRFTIFPNPSSDFITVSMLNNELAVTFSLYDFKGRCVYRKENVGDGAMQISTGGMTTGTYFYQVNRNGEIISNGKLMIMKK